MPDDGKTGLRRFFTILTSPIWVPVTVAASLVAAPFQAIADSVDVADRTKSSGAGLASYPGTAVIRVVTNPINSIACVGESMLGDD